MCLLTSSVIYKYDGLIINTARKLCLFCRYFLDNASCMYACISIGILVFGYIYIYIYMCQ